MQEQYPESLVSSKRNICCHILRNFIGDILKSLKFLLNFKRLIVSSNRISQAIPMVIHFFVFGSIYCWFYHYRDCISARSKTRSWKGFWKGIRNLFLSLVLWFRTSFEHYVTDLIEMVLVPIPRRKNIQRKVYDRTARAKILISLWSIHSKAWPPQSNCWKRLLKIGKGFIPNFHKWCVCYCALFNQLLAFFRVLFVHQEVALNHV